jgi:hypothetical protein
MMLEIVLENVMQILFQMTSVYQHFPQMNVKILMFALSITA